MKANLLSVAILGLGALSAVAQPKFTIANSSLSAVTYDFPGNPLDDQKVLSTGAEKYWAQAYIGLSIDSLIPFTDVRPIGSVAAAAGLFNFSTVTATGYSDGQSVYLQVRGWRDDSGPTSGGWDTATQRGQNTPVQFTTRTTPPVVAFAGSPRLEGFSITIPEPATALLGLTGIAGCLLGRRRAS